MPEIILDGRGDSYTAGVTSDNRLMCDISGAVINIGSVSAYVDSIYIQSGTSHISSGNFFLVSGNNWTGTGSVYNVNASSSIFIPSGTMYLVSGNMYVNSGNFFIAEQTPINSNKNNSAFEYTYTTGNITQIVQTIGASSYVQAWTWGGGSVLTKIGSWI